MHMQQQVLLISSPPSLPPDMPQSLGACQTVGVPRASAHLSSGLAAPKVRTQQLHKQLRAAAPRSRPSRSLLPDALERAGEEVLHVVYDGAAQLILGRDHSDVFGQVPARARSV